MTTELIGNPRGEWDAKPVDDRHHIIRNADRLVRHVRIIHTAIGGKSNCHHDRLDRPHLESRRGREIRTPRPYVLDSRKSEHSRYDVTVPANPNNEVVVTGTAHIGNAIRRSREERGLDQATFADLADVHRTYVSKFESETPRNTIGRLLRMLDALDLELVIRPKRHP